MHPRQAQLLKHLVRLYVSNAEPVSSSALAGIDEDLEFSSATIRNELCALEETGYVRQPHTSAGRVPTAKGYRFYVDHFLEMRALLKDAEQRLRAMRSADDAEAAFKRIAKTLAELTREAVIVSLDEDDIFYTGLSYLLSQPEFSEQSEVASVSHLLDQCGEIVHELTEAVEDDTHVLIGKENPFGDSCALVLSPLPRGFVGVLGPMRMDYDYTMGVMNEAAKLFATFDF